MINTSKHISIQLSKVGIQPIRVPLYSHKVAAGFPSPADDYIEGRLSLDEHLIRIRMQHSSCVPRATAWWGQAYLMAILLVVDKSLTPSSGDIVIAIDGR